MILGYKRLYDIKGILQQQENDNKIPQLRKNEGGKASQVQARNKEILIKLIILQTRSEDSYGYWK